MNTTAMITKHLRILAATTIALATILAVSSMARAEALAAEPPVAQPIPRYVNPSEGIVRLVSKDESGVARAIITRPNGV